MVRDVILPKLGQTMEEGVIVEWLKVEGDRVQRGEVLFVVESDKATLEVEAPANGFLRKILVPAGESVPILTVVGFVTQEPDEDISAHEAGASALPSEIEATGYAAVDEPGAPADEGPPAERERVFASPRARRLAGQEGVNLEDLRGTGPDGRVVERDVQTYLDLRLEVTPVARRLAQREGIDVRTVEGTGPGGRVTKGDVERARAAQKEAVSVVQRKPARVPAAAAPDGPIAGIRARIAQRMHQSHHTTAPVTLTMKVDATAFVELRERLNVSLSNQLGFDLGYNDLLIKVVAHALREFPYMNARLVRDGSEDMTGKVVEHFEHAHVGLAVDTERGLLVPVVWDADQKSLTEIAQSVRELVDRAQSGTATPDALGGGTFTITNLGMYDVDAFTPIVNLPEVAILGVGRIKAEPVVVGGEIAIRQTLWLSLTFDHRLVDGAPAASFLRCIMGLIEEPYLLLA